MHLTLSMAAGPIIGAVIGYFTNNIAVKMLFRPHYEKRIGNFKVPFTPGVIPKEKPRLARAIGEAVGKQLLTEETLTANLISEGIEEKIKDEVGKFIDRQSENEASISESLQNFTTVDKIEIKKIELVQACMDKIEYYIDEISLGKVVADKVVIAANEYIQGTLLAMMITPEFMAPIAAKVEREVNSYLETDGIPMLTSILNLEADHLLNQQISVYGKQIAGSKETIQNAVYQVYETFVKTQMESFIKELDIAGIVESKINEMNVEELEDLVMSVMKNELRAVVNLGAVIGFVLGLVNTFI
ncbi:MAG: DUF445 family protein [Lachnospiraceae bacterium]|nr:DUF445 family protein [Lachnospiraceae bacterium]